MPIESCLLCLMKVQKRLLCFLSGRPRLSGAETVGHMMSSTYSQYSLQKCFWILRCLFVSFEMFMLERWRFTLMEFFLFFWVVISVLWRSMGLGLFLPAFRWGTYCFMHSSSLAVNHSQRTRVRRAVQYSTHHDTRVLQWRVRQNPSVCSTEKSRWKQSPCKIYGLYWKSKVGCRWRMWMRISLNIVKEMLLDFNKCTRKQIWISVNTA